ncbi:LuxR C-terminal-related transcriptional regulator [Planotetraspora phitsanulokensis]|uniref:Helix-turn-helix transcriptional regulator n=1 Tax=Planotetraspora phitsanulokensis TaxID=575192 RepID=A0A8J3U4Q2_9ACTN|nr:helix-turn-helix transcriptional regulator [Planotetraspora phitsanulokensis]GII38424.1 helix-turn-helix transcriptional regulator [Planotetraspora phitsanulokensis]
MTSRREAERRAISDLKDLAGAPLTAPEVFRQADLVLRKLLGYDAVCWHATDPSSGLVASVLTDDLELDDFRQAVQLEIWGDDVARFPEIRLSARVADTLSRATGGVLRRSLRFREQIAPAGFGDELRAVFDAGGGMWGCAAFMRAPDRGPYRPGELALARRAARYIGVALQRSQLREPPSQAALPPAVVLLGPDNHLIDADEQAERLLAEFADDSTGIFSVPTPFVMAAEQARAAVAGTRTPMPLRARGRGGRWFVLHASLLREGPDGPAAVVISPASRAEIMPVVFASYGLTHRECEVALQVVQGRGTGDIAQVLCMTPVTVQDHLKSIFTKSGVRSRREFVAQLLVVRPPEVWT